LGERFKKKSNEDALEEPNEKLKHQYGLAGSAPER
jgi:hypothetical protein